MPQEPTKSRSTSDAPPLTSAQRFKARLVGWAGYAAIMLIGSTLRWESEGEEHLASIHKSGHRAIFTLWHGRLLPAMYFWRRRGIVVMVSQNADGEPAALVLRWLGNGAVRGSSTRGGMRALAQLIREVQRGQDACFIVDGPRGPRYVAKQGPVLLGFKTGAAIFCVHISMKRKIQLRSWDAFQIPLPFTRAVVLHAPPLWVPADSTEEQLRAIHQDMQSILDGLRNRGDAWFD